MGRKNGKGPGKGTRRAKKPAFTAKRMHVTLRAAMRTLIAEALNCPDSSKSDAGKVVAFAENLIGIPAMSAKIPIQRAGEMCAVMGVFKAGGIDLGDFTPPTRAEETDACTCFLIAGALKEDTPEFFTLASFRARMGPPPPLPPA